ncbi:hypothetical protein GN956_G16906 [Arapaima gigas]
MKLGFPVWLSSPHLTLPRLASPHPTPPHLTSPHPMRLLESSDCCVPKSPDAGTSRNKVPPNSSTQFQSRSTVSLGCVCVRQWTERSAELPGRSLYVWSVRPDVDVGFFILM